MRLNLFSLFLLATGSAAVPLCAQNPADVPPPKPPLVVAVPESADWIITAKPAVAAPKPTAANPTHESAYIAEVHSTQSGKIRRDAIAYSDGNKVAHWFIEFVLLWTTPQGEVSVSDLRGAPPTEAEDPDPSCGQGFPGVKWVQLPYYDKVVAVEKHNCYHYANNGNEAWIDVDTKMPVGYKHGNMMYSYKFNDPPVEPLQLPPDYQKAWEKVQLMISRTRRLARPPLADR